MRRWLTALAVLLAGCSSKPDPNRELARHVSRLCDCKDAGCVREVRAADAARLGREPGATRPGKAFERARTLAARLEHCMAMVGLDATGQPLPVPSPSATPTAIPSAGPTASPVASPSGAPTADPTPTARIPNDPKAFGGFFEFRKVCEHMTEVGLRFGATAEAHDKGCADFLTNLFENCDHSRDRVIACMQLAGDKDQFVACGEHCKR